MATICISTTPTITQLRMLDSLLYTRHRESTCRASINTHLDRHLVIGECVPSESPWSTIGYAALKDIQPTRAGVRGRWLGELVYVHSPRPTALVGTGRLTCRGALARRCRDHVGWDTVSTLFLISLYTMHDRALTCSYSGLDSRNILPRTVHRHR